MVASLTVLDGSSFHDEIAGLCRKYPIEKGNADLVTSDMRDTDDLCKALVAEFGSAPNNLQAAIAQFAAAHLTSVGFGRQLWAVPSG